jgi:hypothetical protein
MCHHVIGWMFPDVMSSGECFLTSCHRVNVSWHVMRRMFSDVIPCHRANVFWRHVIGRMFPDVMSSGECFLTSYHVIGRMFPDVMSSGECFLCHRANVSWRHVIGWMFPDVSKSLQDEAFRAPLLCKASVTTQPTTPRHIPEVFIPQQHRCDNLGLFVY